MAGVAMADSTRKRRWFAFRLRTLLVLFLGHEVDIGAKARFASALLCEE